MNDKIKQLLKGAGFTQSVIDDSEKDDFEPKAALTALHEKHKKEYTEIVTNEVKEAIENETISKRDGYWLGVLNTDLKKRGVDIEAIKDKKTHEKLDAYKAHIEAQLSTVNNASTETIKKLQEDLLTANNKVVEKEAEFNERIKQIQKEEQGKTVNTFVDLGLQKYFNQIPDKHIMGDSEQRKPEIFQAVSTLLKTKYDFSIDNSNEPVIFEKGTQKRVVLKEENNGKEYFAPVKTLLEGQIKALGLWKESNGGQGSGSQGQGGGSQGKTQPSQRFLELQKKAQQVEG